MTDSVNFVAACDKFVFFAIAEDPAGMLMQMQPHCPLPFELLSGWIVSPQLRGEVHVLITRHLHHLKVKVSNAGDWFRLDRDQAEDLLAQAAEHAGGKKWLMRKRPITDMLRTSMLARPVVTPYGRFHSANAAAKALGITRAAVSLRALKRSPGWRYMDDIRPQPELPPLGRPPLTDDDEDEEAFA
jgi:hypothetical protein